MPFDQDGDSVFDRETRDFPEPDYCQDYRLRRRPIGRQVPRCAEPQWPTSTEERLRDRLEAQIRETAHFKAVAEDLERSLQSARRDNERLIGSRRQTDAALRHAEQAVGGCAADFRRQDDFTVCMLGDPAIEQLFVGVAKCAPGDKFDDHIGRAISLGRAMQARADYYANGGRS